MNKDHFKTVAALDQAGANLSPFAQMLATYHNHLCSSGFQRDEALELVKALQTVMFTQAFNLTPKDTED